MAKKRRKAEYDAAEPPMSSMIDVVFLLLIYFVVTQKPLIPEAHLAVNLPSPGQSSGPPPKTPPVSITVMSNDYYYMDVPQNVATIENALTGLGNQNADVVVTIKTAVDAQNKRLVRILDICKKAGLNTLNVVTLQ